jgi:NNP family nitrate/nitrite transporter-like MFS transporter
MSDKYGARAVMYGVLISCIISCAVLSVKVPFMAFVVISCFVGTVMGIGMAAVYKHIPVYFPTEVPVVGAMVGVIGGVGGFILPNVFKSLLKATVSEQNPNGNFATSWMVLTIISLLCLIWMFFAIKKIEGRQENKTEAAVA